MWIRLVGALSAAALFAAPALGQGTPPPPPRYAEFFHPTAREHSVSGTCPGGTAAMVWTFDGQSAHLRDFSIGGRTVDQAQLDRLQGWMSEIGGDVLVDLECGGESAGLRLISAQFAGTAQARAIMIFYLDGQFSEFARYNFDGRRISMGHRERQGEQPSRN
jgi:hypothetical protein